LVQRFLFCKGYAIALSGLTRNPHIILKKNKKTFCQGLDKNFGNIAIYHKNVHKSF